MTIRRKRQNVCVFSRAVPLLVHRPDDHFAKKNEINQAAYLLVVHCGSENKYIDTHFGIFEPK